MENAFFESLPRSIQEQYLLQKEILAGEYGQPGSPFMTTRTLAERRQVSVVTAHNILSGLCDEGYLKLRGKRYYLSHARIVEKQHRYANVIGMLVPQLNEYFSSLAEAVSDSLRKQNYEVLLLSSAYSPAEEKKQFQLIQHIPVAGIISCTPISPENIELYRDCSIPCVLMGHALDNSKRSSVQVNSFTISQKAAKHLIDEGYRKFIYLGSRSCPLDADVRFAGFQMQLRQHGYVLDGQNTLQVSSRNRADDNLIATLLEQHQEPVGIFCYHDLIAAQLYQICRRLGKQIPVDVGVIGFDDLSVATVLSPSLTTIQYRITSMAEMATNLILDNIHNPNTPFDNYYVEPNLIVRESSTLSGHK